MWATITKPFAWLLLWFYDLTGNYGISVILFALVVNLILAPFMGKSKKSTMRTTRLKPRIDEIQRRHEGNPQKLNEEMAKLYKEEHINPMSGCLWSLLPFPILIALYSVIRQPLTRMMSLSADIVTKIQDYFVNAGLYTVPTSRDAYAEIKLAQLVHEHWNELQAALPGQLGNLQDIDFTFLGMNMGNTPQWNFFTKVDWSNTASWLPELGLFLIPIIAAFLSWLSMKVGNLANPPDPQTQAQMKTMNIFMPIMSIWMCFVMPAALGVYWIANSLFGMARDYLQTKYYKKVLDREDAERIAARQEREKELENKHRETLRKKAQGTTEINANTSKKKLQSQQKAERDERRAAAARAERKEKNARRGVPQQKAPDSQVGNRRYARGRAYEADRFRDTDMRDN
jgi:YidC/Oxa1 family membrane protein insertase